MAIAMANGTATIATVSPAVASARALAQEYPSCAGTVIDFGMNSRQSREDALLGEFPAWLVI